MIRVCRPGCARWAKHDHPQPKAHRVTRTIDDVPLICDPVLGPANYDVERIITAALALKFCGEMAVVLGREPTPTECIEQAELEAGCAPNRTEWPDAEFCAA